MPELLRMPTDQFEFSIWTNDISKKQRAYQATLDKHAYSDAEAKYPLKLSPSQNLLSISQSSNDSSEPVFEARSAIEFSEPIFFENTQYQLEWVFDETIDSAQIDHRNQTLNKNFRFIKKKGAVLARLVGVINTGNDIGWLHIPLLINHDIRLVISFEVLPTKILLQKDLPNMYDTIDQAFPLWRFSLINKTDQDTSKSRERGNFPLFWLANFSQLRTQLEQGLKIINQAPHSRLQPLLRHSKADRIKGNVSNKLAEKVRGDIKKELFNKRYRVEKKFLCVDTPENRFIKMVVSRSKNQLADFERRLKKGNQASKNQPVSNAFLTELNQWQQPLNKMLTQGFLTDVGASSQSHSSSLVLQQKTGYSAVYRVWQELKYYLDVFAKESSLSMKSVAEIYEVWCFLCIKKIMQEELNFELVKEKKGSLKLNDFFEYKLQDGFTGAFTFKRSDGVTARLAHEPKFGKKSAEIRSYLVQQKPDIVLEVTVPASHKEQSPRQFIWIFDAKYRIATEKQDEDKKNKDKPDTRLADLVPIDAINQMHRYRDALIRISELNTGSDKTSLHKSRPVFGAFALYPGLFDQENDENPYAEAIEEVGIGAFPLLPSINGNSSNQWLVDYLKGQLEPQSHIAELSEKIHIQEPARIASSGMKQSLYADLAFTIRLGDKREDDYLNSFRSGDAKFYHMPIDTFNLKFSSHIANEIRFIAIAIPNENQAEIPYLWPVQSVLCVKRNELNGIQTGAQPSIENQDKNYWLFKLSKPIKLGDPIPGVPLLGFRKSMKLTRLSSLMLAKSFEELDSVYEQAISSEE